MGLRPDGAGPSVACLTLLLIIGTPPKSPVSGLIFRGSLPWKFRKGGISEPNFRYPLASEPKPMKTRPFSKHKPNDKVIYIQRPIVERDEAGRVRWDDHGNPIFKPTFPTDVVDEVKPVMVRKGFIAHYFRRDVLKPAAQIIFMHLTSLCEYSKIEVFYDDISGEPMPAGKMGKRSMAKLLTPGNVTVSFTYEAMVKRTGYDQKTVRDALMRLVELRIIAKIPVPQSSRTKYKKTGGRPLDLLRYEINSEHAWNGPFAHGLAYPCFSNSFELHGEAEEDSNDAS